MSKPPHKADAVKRQRPNPVRDGKGAIVPVRPDPAPPTTTVVTVNPTSSPPKNADIRPAQKPDERNT